MGAAERSALMTIFRPMVILGTGARRFAGAIEDAVGETVDKADDVVDDVMDKAEDVVDGVVDKAKDVAEATGDAVGDVVEKAKDLVDRDKD